MHVVLFQQPGALELRVLMRIGQVSSMPELSLHTLSGRYCSKKPRIALCIVPPLALLFILRSSSSAASRTPRTWAAASCPPPLPRP
jgi:hypothetical protein